MLSKTGIFLEFSKILIDNNTSVWNYRESPHERTFKRVHDSLLMEFHNGLPRTSLITIYKSFLRSNLDYGDITHDHTTYNMLHTTSPFIRN